MFTPHGHALGRTQAWLSAGQPPKRGRGEGFPSQTSDQICFPINPVPSRVPMSLCLSLNIFLRNPHPSRAGRARPERKSGAAGRVGKNQNRTRQSRRHETQPSLPCYWKTTTVPSSRCQKSPPGTLTLSFSSSSTRASCHISCSGGFPFRFRFPLLGGRADGQADISFRRVVASY